MGPAPQQPPAPDPAIGQREAIKTALTAAETAVEAVMDDSTDAVVSAADTALAKAREAIAAAANVPPNETSANTDTVNVLANRLSTAKTNRLAAMNADRTANATVIAALARKLYGGRPAFNSNNVNDGIVARNPASDNAPRAFYSGDEPTDSLLTVNFPTDSDTYNLTEDKKTTVAPHLGWAGKRFTFDVPGSEFGLPKGTLEAVVYSSPKEEGKKFASSTSNDDYEYMLDAQNNTELIIDTGEAAVQARIDSPSFDQTAGKKDFKLPTNTVRVLISGSYHGVSGTFYCDPDGTNTCSVRKAATGFELGSIDGDNPFSNASGATWTFKASNNEDKVVSAPGMNYVSYGWWLFKSADDKTYAASAFSDEHMEVPDANGITALRGTATYTGGAAGQYALTSTTGGTNDAGRFTARATLEADFGTDMVTGRIHGFTGADGESRNWSVALKKSGVSDDGTIRGADGTGDLMKTVWTIGGTAAAESGQWQGRLLDNGDDNVPKVGMGTFYTEYSNSGKMVGGFGVKKQ